MTVVIDCPTAADTVAVARRLAPLVAAGDVILLGGELGAGKTTFTQGLAAGLGVEAPVTSPTFTLLCSYPTARGFDLLHADVYRLERATDIAALGLAELLEEDAAAVIEWGQRAVPVLAPGHLSVGFEFGDRDGWRRLSFHTTGEHWTARRAQLVRAVTGGEGR